MQKIMFNDRYGLTQAVLKGRKTMTRRTIDVNPEFQLVAVSFDKQGRLCVTFDSEDGNVGDLMFCSRYRIGEVVAVAQAYCSDDFCEHIPILHGVKIGTEAEGAFIGIYNSLKGWNNKMFVRADLMPHQIRITDIKVERLQDISDDDCLREGVYLTHFDDRYYRYSFTHSRSNYHTPRQAFSTLIDKVSSKGTWERNPWCFVYTFELVK